MRLPDLAGRFLLLLRHVLEARQQILACQRPYPALRNDVQRLVPAGFLERVPFERLADLHRYLKAVQTRAERFAFSASRDEEKARQVAPHAELVDRLLEAGAEPGSRRARLLEELHWMMEEWRVSVFAQELGTAQPVSPKRLDAAARQVESAD